MNKYCSAGLMNYVHLWNLISCLLLLVTPVQSIFANSGSTDICRQYINVPDKAGTDFEDPQIIAYPTGLLWKIEDSDQTSYVFGTMHSQDRLVTDLPPSVRLALVKSRVLVMEVQLDNESGQIFFESIYFNDDSSLSKLLNKEIYKKLQSLVSDYGIPTENTWRLKPWAAFTLIGRPRPVRGPTQDNNLMHIAYSVNIKITGLESMSQLIESLENINIDDQIEILNDTVCNHAEIIRNTKKLVDLYVARDLAGITKFNQQPHHDEEVYNRFMQTMVVDRNKRMLTKIVEITGNGGAFIAVGALHLPGEKGLLKMLESEGYRITRIY